MSDKLNRTHQATVPLQPSALINYVGSAVKASARTATGQACQELFMKEWVLEDYNN